MNKMRYFQWIAGDRRGEVLFLDKIEEDEGEVYLSFKDGSRINTEFVAEINQRDLSGKMMAEVESPKNIWKFNEKTSENNGPRYETDWESQVKYEIPSPEEIANADLTESGGKTKPIKKKKVIELVPPKPTYTKFGKVDNQESEPEKPKVNTSDPVYIMMEKAKKFDTNVPMELVISLPSKSLYNVAKESFDNGNEKVIDYIISNIDDKKLKENLKKALFIAYEDETEEQPILKVEHHIIPENKKKKIQNNSKNKEEIISSYEPEVVEEPFIGDPQLSKDKKIK